MEEAEPAAMASRCGHGVLTRETPIGTGPVVTIRKGVMRVAIGREGVGPDQMRRALGVVEASDSDRDERPGAK